MGKKTQGWRQRIFGGGKERELENKLHELHTQASSEPNNPRWHHKLGETYRRLNKRRKSILSYYRAAELYAEDGFVLKAIAMCKMILDQDPHHHQTQEMLSAFSQARQSEQHEDLLIVGLSSIKRSETEEKAAEAEAPEAAQEQHTAKQEAKAPPASLSLSFDDINNLDAVKADVLQQSEPDVSKPANQDENEDAALAFLMDAFQNETAPLVTSDSEEPMASKSSEETHQDLVPVEDVNILDDIELEEDIEILDEIEIEDDEDVEEISVEEEVDEEAPTEDSLVIEDEVNILDEEDLLELDPMAALEDAVSEVIEELSVEDLISIGSQDLESRTVKNTPPSSASPADFALPSQPATQTPTLETNPAVQSSPATAPLKSKPVATPPPASDPFQPMTPSEGSNPFQPMTPVPATDPFQPKASSALQAEQTSVSQLEEKTTLMENPLAVLDPFRKVEHGVQAGHTVPETAGVPDPDVEDDPGEQTDPNHATEALEPPPMLQPKFLPPSAGNSAAWVEQTQADVQISMLQASGPLDSLQLGTLVAEAKPIEQIHSPTNTGRIYQIPIDDSYVGDGPSSEQLLQQIAPIPLFSSLPVPVLQMLLAEASYFELEPGEVIIQQGYLDTSLFVLIEGEIAVFHEGPPRRELARLGEGAFFGEIALISDEPRTATVEATTESTVLEISREMIGRLVQHYPNVLQLLLRFFRERLLQKLIETSNLFAQFSGSERYRLMQRFAFLEAEPNSELIQENMSGEALYILLSGRASVETSRSGQPQQIATVGPGDVFGEISLLFGQPTTATVRTLKKCWLLRLDRMLFQQQLLEQPKLHAIINQLAMQRTQQLKQMFSYQTNHLPLY
ncbi:MAG: cyclic nucleotide-binding domain-containing protein [Deltaproteobacteria bacterium]|nr:MAG: cyclic nucleotide-binding domain-containing protein [Deltaproteobacteria bacterium]